MFQEKQRKIKEDDEKRKKGKKKKEKRSVRKSNDGDKRAGWMTAGGQNEKTKAKKRKVALWFKTA